MISVNTGSFESVAYVISCGENKAVIVDLMDLDALATLVDARNRARQSRIVGIGPDGEFFMMGLARDGCKFARRAFSGRNSPYGAPYLTAIRSTACRRDPSKSTSCSLARLGIRR